jgi:hypothetical protein
MLVLLKLRYCDSGIYVVFGGQWPRPLFSLTLSKFQAFPVRPLVNLGNILLLQPVPLQFIISDGAS